MQRAGTSHFLHQLVFEGGLVIIMLFAGQRSHTTENFPDCFPFFLFSIIAIVINYFRNSDLIPTCNSLRSEFHAICFSVVSLSTS